MSTQHTADHDAPCTATEARYPVPPLRCYLSGGHDGPHRDSVLGTLWWSRVTPPEVSAS